MNLQEFLMDPKWDMPFFKKLPKNDTGDAPGHQGGLVVPKDMRIYFPKLIGDTTSDRPTVDHAIKALLYDGTKKVESVSTRYQFQTWGGTRSPESRLTGNLGSIRDLAKENDVMVFQRNLENLDLYRFVLVKQKSPHYIELAQTLPSGRWGILFDEKPVSQIDVNKIEQEEKEQESQPFKLFEEERREIETKGVYTARSIVFKHTIRRIYNNKCVICNTGMITPTGVVEIQASHIVPKKFNGSEDARNGLSFCQRHHWAFDMGLFGVDDNYKVIVPQKVANIPCNSILTELVGSNIINPSEMNLKPDLAALHWHRSHILVA